MPPPACSSSIDVPTEPEIGEQPIVEEACPRCGKPPALCVCQGLEPVANKVALLILQHPQEQDVALGTARLAVLSLTNAEFKIGLSWPSLAAALGREADPKRWAVVYLGSTQPAEVAPEREVIALDRKGVLLPEQDKVFRGLEGVVLLDGSWSQAKALWWRNAWMLKSVRIALNPKQPSHYGNLRKEPRRDGLSTIESAGLVLARLEGKPEIEATLLKTFDAMLDAYRKSRPKPDRRRHRGPGRGGRGHKVGDTRGPRD